MVLDPAMLWLNTPERGIFIDPVDAVAALHASESSAEGLVLAVRDVWDSRRGYERHSPDSFHGPRPAYIADASARMAKRIAARRAAEPPAGADLPARLVEFFQSRLAALSPEMRRRIGARLLVETHGRQAGAWTVDFNAPGPGFVREGASPDWTYRVGVEDHLLYPFLTGQEHWLEDLFLSLRVNLARRPDVYNEPLYHFFYDPDPVRLDSWYATH
jgi:hypothetical protein